ncbi:MAG TPA: hypothetical protein PLP23_10155 [Panacibacter sp.]|nr:hypothetical protein [Panacibacter sp.]
MIELEPSFRQFLEDNFELIESKFDGAVNIYSSKKLKLRIVRDQNTKLFMDISTLDNPQTSSDWVIMDDLRSYMLNNDDYLEYTDFYKVSSFFQENFDNILSLLNMNYDNVKKALKERGEYRAELRYGPIQKQDFQSTHKSFKENQQQNKKPWWKF